MGVEPKRSGSVTVRSADDGAETGGLRRKPPASRRPIILVLFAFSVLLALAVQHFAARSELARVNGLASEALALQHATLTGVLEKYRLMPALLVKRDDFIALMQGPPTPGRKATAMRLLSEVASLSGAQDAVLLDTDSRPIAAARGAVPPQTWQMSTIKQPLEERRLARAEVQLVDGNRAYMFAAQARVDNTPVGAVAIVAPFAAIDRAWSLSRNPIFVTDRANRIFLSNRSDWTGEIWTGEASDGATVLARYDPANANHVRGPDNIAHVEAVRTMPLLGWTLHVLVDARTVTQARIQSGMIALGVLLAISTVIIVTLRRQDARLRQMRKDRANALRLERKVRDRTRALLDANTALSHEVTERSLAEKQLRATQNELIHSAKLATIGQMAAALSHEYNQPLGAMRTYADNAQKLVERNQPDKAREAMGRITQLVDRMAALSRTFLTFSRKPGTEMKSVPVGSIIDEALMLMRSRIDKAGAEMVTEIANDAVAMTGRTRLSQVVVNLISNAIEAADGTDGRQTKIRITAMRAGDRIVLSVEDNGPGISPEARADLFTPFYTTKADGHGLGLSIVDSILRDLGGTIEVETSDLGGAFFRIDLPAADAPGTGVRSEVVYEPGE